MKTYAITVSVVEYYSRPIIVQASSKAEALRKVKEEYEEDDYLYTKITDCRNDCEVIFRRPVEVEVKPYNIDIK